MKPRSGHVVVVLVTCPTMAVAKRLAGRLVQRRQAACVNIVPGLTSVFRWQGKIERAPEILLVIKTARKRFAELSKTIRALHPYDVPEIIAWPVTAGHPPYLSWVIANTWA
ncbi:MAG: divalent-cation tolerance protein CutA [Candidatus Omnitrophica bacterium]|nr:divalent-cation tolerance protein CutA [Candidatus Omnitrophota bacterium]